MPTDPQDLQQRIARIGANDLVRGFNLSAVFGVVEEHAGTAAAEELRAPIGKRVLGFFNYPAADFLRVAYRAVDLIEPQYGSTDAAFRALGTAVARSLIETSVGKTLLNFLRGRPPEELVRHIPAAYGMAVTFGERVVLPAEARAAKLIFKNELLPAAYHEGVVATGFTAAGFDVVVEGLITPNGDCELLVRWR